MVGEDWTESEGGLVSLYVSGCVDVEVEVLV